MVRRSPRKIFLGGVAVTLPGVFVSYTRSPRENFLRRLSRCNVRRNPCKLGGLLKVNVFLLQTACHRRLSSASANLLISRRFLVLFSSERMNGYG